MSERWLRYDELVALYGRMAAEDMLSELEAHVRARHCVLSAALTPDARWNLVLEMLRALPKGPTLALLLRDAA